MGEDEVRARILDAAFTAFVERGYTATSTAEIASRASVSKRELYSLVGNKQEMLIACMSRRVKRWHVQAEMSPIRDRQALEDVLVTVGSKLVREITDPAVIASFRLAIAEVPNAPEVAQTLDSVGRNAFRVALHSVMARAKDDGLLRGDPAENADLFGALLLRNVMINLLLGVAKRPSESDAAKRAGAAAAAFLKLSESTKSYG